MNKKLNMGKNHFFLIKFLIHFCTKLVNFRKSQLVVFGDFMAAIILLPLEMKVRSL